MKNLIKLTLITFIKLSFFNCSTQESFSLEKDIAISNASFINDSNESVAVFVCDENGIVTNETTSVKSGSSLNLLNTIDG